jgi:hypothetical protein
LTFANKNKKIGGRIRRISNSKYEKQAAISADNQTSFIIYIIMFIVISFCLFTTLLVLFFSPSLLAPLANENCPWTRRDGKQQ